MKQHIARLQESGLSIHAYCQQVGFSLESMRYWMRKIRAANKQPLAKKKDMFIEPGSFPQEAFNHNPSSFSNQTSPRAQVELTFSSGLSLKIYG